MLPIEAPKLAEMTQLDRPDPQRQTPYNNVLNNNQNDIFRF